MPDVIFACPDVTTFCRLDELGLEVTGHRSPVSAWPAVAAAGVVVSAHYRSGSEGFAHLNDAPDNRALLEQLAALRWVRDEVSQFGGDPDQVTVLGQSGGAGSIVALLTRPAEARLFRRAILQEPPGTYLSPALGAGVATEICAGIGRVPQAVDLVACRWTTWWPSARR